MTLSFPSGDARSHQRPVRVFSRRLAPALALCALVLAGCATGPNADPRDPLEPYNRSMTRFNDGVDAAVLKPVASAYQEVVPMMARTGVSNFFANLGDAWSFVNNTLQLRAEGALSSFFRFSTNTFLGLGGILDVASEMGLERHKQDFGLTLGRWGVPAGPYLVLPILGPSTVRDTLALPVDWKGGVVGDITPVATRNSLYALRVVNTRSNLMRVGDVLNAAALDKYSFTRDVFLQVRSHRVAESDNEGYSDDGAAPGDANGGMLPPEPAQ